MNLNFNGNILILNFQSSIMVEFETGKWIIAHKSKYDLSQSGMSGRIDIEKYFKNCSFTDENTLKEKIAELNDSSKDNVVITHGATEALFLTLYYLKTLGMDRFMVQYPEYEPIYKIPLELEMKYGTGGIFLGSNTNNPTGAEIKIDDNFKFYVIDDTFLQFYKDLDKARYPQNTFRINTFTKFYGGDDVRVGYIIAPDQESAKRINSFKGIFTEQVSRYNVCVAKKILDENDNFKDYVKNEMQKNLNFLKNHLGKLKFFRGIEPVLGTVSFIDYSYYSNLKSYEFSEFLFKNEISAVPGNLFGIEGTYIRVCYSRENFSESFEKLLEILEGL